MWPIVKAEFRYSHRSILLIAAFVIPGTLLYFRASATAGVSAMLFPLTVATIMTPIMVRSIEKRVRQNVLLPLAVKQIAWARVLLILTPAAGYYAVYFLLHAIFASMSSRWQHDVYDLMMFFGLIVFGFCAFFILKDLLSGFYLKRKALELELVILLALTAVVLLGVPIALATIYGSTGNVLRLLCFASGFVSLYPAVIFFERRRAYLE